MNRYYYSTPDAAKQNEVIFMTILIDNSSDGYLCEEKSGSRCEDVDSDTGESGGLKLGTLSSSGLHKIVRTTNVCTTNTSISQIF